MTGRERIQGVVDAMGINADVILLKKNSSSSESECMRVTIALCAGLDITLDQLKNTYEGKKSGKTCKRYKSIILNILYDDFFFTQKIIAKVIGLDRTTVNYHVQVGYKMRNNNYWRIAYDDCKEIAKTLLNEI